MLQCSQHADARWLLSNGLSQQRSWSSWMKHKSAVSAGASLIRQVPFREGRE